MTYIYDFDETTVGALRFPSGPYQELHEGLFRLRVALDEWNEKTLAAGAVDAPYEREVADLEAMLDVGAELLGVRAHTIQVPGVSRGSLAYLRAGIEYRIRTMASDLEQKRRDGWPPGTLAALRAAINGLSEVAGRLDREYGVAPAPVLWEILPRADAEEVVARLRASDGAISWDAFICHASEDKEDFVRGLAAALADAGLRVWYDEFELHVGSSIRRTIDKGLAGSRYGVVVLSPSFFAKEWPQRELDGLVARQIAERPLILPVWHHIDADAVRRFSPPLADLRAARSEEGVDQVAATLIRAIRR